MKVFAATVLVGNPFALLAGVVQIEHGGNGVHAQAVDVVFVQPKERVRNQIVLNFIAPVVVDKRAPVGMRALAWIGVFVEVRAVKLRQAVRVAREVRGRPIEKNADTGLMAAVNELHKLGGRTVSAGSRKVADGLVAP